MPSEKEGGDPVSFTDTNAETQGGGGGGGNANSAMLDLIGNLKKQQQQTANTNESKDSETSGTKKKKKKGKSKTKKVRKQDRFESQNYMLRIEGTICFATLICVALLFLCNMIVFMGVMIATKAQVEDVIFHEEKKL